MVVLGILFNTIDMTISIAPDDVEEICNEVEAWLDRTKMSHKQLESLIRIVQFAAQVIRVVQTAFYANCCFLVFLFHHVRSVR